MLRKATNLINLPVLETINHQRLGKAVNFIVDPARQKIGALVMNYGSWFNPGQFVSTVDIIELGPNAVLIRERGAVVPSEELGLLRDYINQRINLLGFKAVTLNKKILGRVTDFLFDETDFAINRYHIKGSKGELIIESNKVARIEPDKKTIVFQETELAILKKESITASRLVSLDSR